MRVYHILPTLVYGDAVSNDARALNSALVAMGWHSKLYVARTVPRFLNSIAFPADAMPQTFPEDILIYHLSTGDALNERLIALPGHKLIIYHNITPPEFFAPYAPAAAALTAQGYEQVKALAAVAEYCLADSAYNAAELRRMGYTCPIDVVPILIPFDDYRRTPDAAVQKKYSDGRTNLLFVGRIAPNKRQEDVIRAFDCYKKTYDPTARLFLVGSYNVEDAYYITLRRYCKNLGVKDVIFPGHIRFEEILAYYAASHAFLCMSDHEGFCVPLVEAMCFGVPIVAKSTTAVGETMGGGGLLLPDNSPTLAAAALHRLLADAPLRAQLAAGQQQRLKDFSYQRVVAQFQESFAKFIAQAGLKP
ncbi:MAG: glycosyltransferase family 4 protein [Gemmiger sp.]|nr:glycosyltransferase family 4 protein [Gemmiger sp.]